MKINKLDAELFFLSTQRGLLYTYTTTTMQDHILHSFPLWEKTKRDIADDPASPNLWNDLVNHHEKLINDHRDLLRTRHELKQALTADMDILLTRFPYHTVFWKRYIAMVLSLEGLEASIHVMERSLVASPHSLDLWTDYLSTILSNSLKDHTQRKVLFTKAASNVGFHFLAHKFWDIYLNWAKSLYGVNSNDYIHILLKVLRIPLHQYAKYSDEFNELRNNFTISDLIEREDLISYIKKKEYDAKDIDEYIETHSEDIIHAYFNDILDEVESRAQAKWKYESIVKQDFDMNMVTLEELNQWIDYLNYEETYHKTNQNDESNILALYERATIPTCLSDKIWIKYTRYLIQNNARDDQIVQIFNKSCDHFVPLDLKQLRYMYIKFIELKLKKIDDCKIIFTNLIKQCPSESEPVTKYLEFLQNHTDTDFFQDIVNCVLKFNEENSTEHINKKKKSNKPYVLLKIKNKDIGNLYNHLTFWNVGELIVFAAKHYWLVEKDLKRSRDTLMSVFNTYAISSSKSYWFFFFKFELCQRNKKNLFNIVECVKIKSTLNISDINLLIEEYNSFIMKNFTVADIKQNERDIIKNMLEIDPESSMHMKHFLKTRLADDKDEDTINKRLVKENGHPAAICEGRPTLTNPLLVSEYTFKSIPPLPHFRNVEKASLNVKYIHESI